jgi:molybdate transport system substrate-binding protein
MIPLGWGRRSLPGKAAFLLLSLCAPVSAEEVTLFGAASLTDVLREAGTAFEARTGHKVMFNFGASNDLARQIQAGAPADVFFSADTPQMDVLEKAGLVKGEERVDVLSNALVIVVPASSTRALSSAADLLGCPRIALADPQAVPAGIYARTYLESLDLWGKIKDKVVPMLNVRAALAAVESEHADAAIVYRTDAAISPRVKVAFEVPADRGPRIVYPLASIVGSKKAATAELRRFLTSPEALSIYAKQGFVVLLK